MELTKAIEFLKYDIEGQLQGKLKTVPIIRGNPGIGKTSMLKQLTDQLNCHLYYLSLGSKALEYYSGIPDIIHENGTSYAKWSVPELIYEVNELAKTKDVLILLDDIHVMDMNAQKYMFELLLERSLHGNKLSKNTAIVASANTSDKSGWEGFFAAIINRFKFYDVYFSFDKWYQLFGYTLNYYVTGFMRANPEFISQEECVDKPFATPRAWSEFAAYIDIVPEEIWQTNSSEIARTYVSDEAAIAFSTYFKILKNYNLEEKFHAREIVLSQSNSAPEQIIKGVIARFVKTPADVDYIMKLLRKYHKEFPNFVQSVALEAQTCSKNSDNAMLKQLLLNIINDKDIVKTVSQIFV